MQTLAVIALCIVAVTDEAPAARAHFDALHRSLGRIESQLPRITDAADLAAPALIDGADLDVRDGALAGLLRNSPGAMFTSSGHTGRSVIVSVDGHQLIITVDDTDVVIDTGGAVAAAAWTFQCELFAACTRLGEIAVVRQSFEIDTKRKRYWCYGSQRFHHDRWLDPISPGSLGQRYLDGLRSVLRDVGTASWDAITETAQRARDTLDAGGRVFVVAGGPYVPHVIARDPSPFIPLTDEVLGENDFIIAVGTHAPAGDDWWGDVDRLRRAGRGIAWIVNAYNTHPRDLNRDEIVIDLWCPVGDGVVKVEHYDARLGPVSSVVAEAVVRMLMAESDHDQQTGSTG